jgi:hypothetical protein
MVLLISPLEERRVLPYDKPYTMAIPSARFFLNKRIKCMHDHEVWIKVAYYTPSTKWYDRHTKADRIEKLVAVPAAATITELTTLALQKFHLPHGVPYTCSTGTEKYGMTVLLQGKGKSKLCRRKGGKTHCRSFLQRAYSERAFQSYGTVE